MLVFKGSWLRPRGGHWGSVHVLTQGEFKVRQPYAPLCRDATTGLFDLAGKVSGMFDKTDKSQGLARASLFCSMILNTCIMRSCV